MKFIHYCIFLGVFAVFTTSIVNGQIYHDFPPTRAFDHIITSNGTLQSKNYYSPINLKGINVNITSSNKTNTIFIGNATEPPLNVVYIYDTNINDYTTPSSDFASSSCCSAPIVLVGSNNTNTVTNSAGFNGDVFVSELTGLTPGKAFNTVSLYVHNAVGNVRVKVYNSDGSGGIPNTLLGESNSFAVPGPIDAWNNFTLISSGTVPAGGKVWAGFETDSATQSFYYLNTGTKCGVVHTYGTGPAPFGSCSSSGNGISVKLFNIPSGSNPASNAIDGNTATYWESNKETNPWIYVDMGSTYPIGGSAIYWNGTSTTTKLLIQTSVDKSVWNTKRTINTVLLKDKSWNFIRWDFEPSEPRYIRFYSGDASQKELSIYEIKGLVVTISNLLEVHGHKWINPFNGSLPINN